MIYSLIAAAARIPRTAAGGLPASSRLEGSRQVLGGAATRGVTHGPAVTRHRVRRAVAAELRGEGPRGRRAELLPGIQRPRVGDGARGARGALRDLPAHR